MSDTTAPVWGVWSIDWVLRDTSAERPALETLNGRIVTLDHSDGRREAWKVAGGELTVIESRLCGICRERPVGRGGQMCPACFDRLSTKAATDPYGMDDKTEER